MTLPWNRRPGITYVGGIGLPMTAKGDERYRAKMAAKWERQEQKNMQKRRE